MGISRRSALGSIASVFVSPMIRLRATVPSEQLMLPFCTTEDWHPRWHMHTPFGIGSLTYATDAVGMIRAEIASPDVIGKQRTPPAAEAWGKYWHPDHKWQPLTQDIIKPTLVDGIMSRCPECGDRYVSLGKEYPDFSDPVVDAMVHRYSYDPDTNSIRDKSCPVCEGLPFYGPANVRLLGHLHHSYTLRRIVALPNVMVCRSRAHDDVLLFKADGYEGCQMSLME